MRGVFFSGEVRKSEFTGGAEPPNMEASAILSAICCCHASNSCIVFVLALGVCRTLRGGLPLVFGRELRAALVVPFDFALALLGLIRGADAERRDGVGAWVEFSRALRLSRRSRFCSSTRKRSEVVGRRKLLIDRDKSLETDVRGKSGLARWPVFGMNVQPWSSFS